MIQFYRGLRSKYNYPDNTSLVDAIFFATDTGEILINGENFGTDINKVADVTFDGNTNTFTFTKGDGSNVVAALGDKLLTDSDKQALESVKEILESGNLSVTYIPGVDDSVATVDKLGGIAAGTTAGSLKNKTISAVLDDLLFPTVQPTAVEPSVSLSLKAGQANIREIGSAAPIASNFTATWNPGSIKIGSSVQSNRAGEKTAEVIYAGTESNVVGSQAGVVTAGTTNYYYKVTYAAGPTPLDSKGQVSETLTALPAGSKVSSAVAVHGVYPFYATTTDANIAAQTVTKLALTNNTSFIVAMAGEKDGENGVLHQIFKLPHTVTKIEALNTLSNQYEVTDINNWTKTQEVISVQSNDVVYNVYTRNESKSGETTFRITYSK